MLDPRNARKLVVYGGSFDPPHRAHLELPFEVARAIGADGVLFVPAGQPPHKSRRVSAAHHRLRMLQVGLGVADERSRGDAAIWTSELERSGPSYTVDTLRQLRAELGEGVELRLLIGADMAVSFYDWREPREIERLAEPVVMMRPPADPRSLLAALPAELDGPARQRWGGRIVATPQIDVESTRLRQLLAAGEYDHPHIQQMLHPAVLSYIRRHQLYQGDSADGD